ncbi:MAG: hypothetical protein IJ861_01070 [Clostridia bacterium]|nr:hypothetical protein [Clostridia bacterium]
MKKSTVILIALVAFFVGVVGGFSFSPVKHGINIDVEIGNNSGNKTIHKTSGSKPELPEKSSSASKADELKTKRRKGKWIGQKSS